MTEPQSVASLAVVVGSDGKLWVTEFFAGRIARLSAIGGAGKAITATHGVLFSGAVATFKDGTPAAMQTDFTATINWGDGSANSTGTIAGASGGPFTVSGTHTYAKAGTFKVSVTLHDTVDNSNYPATPSNATVN